MWVTRSLSFSSHRILPCAYPANRLVTITQGSTVVTLTYDAAGRRTSLTLPNGVVTEATYDAASRVTGLTYRQGITTLGTLSYTYDAVGNRVGVGGTWARTALPPALDATSYDAANRHLTFDGQVLAYDLNGNVLSDGTSGYTWDARNRLTGITGPITATFDYDATGRRTRKTIGGVTTDFLHDGLTPVTESSAGGTGLLLTGLAVDDFLLRLGPGSPAMFLTDALGSLVATTDAAGGVQSELTYEPFGATELSAPAPAYRFTGREHDEPLDLYYYRARYYHTDLQRFISEDPIGFQGGDFNLYAYVHNRPTGLTDPLGLCARGNGPTMFASSSEGGGNELPCRQRCWDNALAELTYICGGVGIGGGVSACALACTPTLLGGPAFYTACLGSCIVRLVPTIVSACAIYVGMKYYRCAQACR